MQEPENTVLYIDGDTLAHAPDRNLTPEKATALLAMVSEQIQRYSRPAFNMIRTAARLVTAQRPFYERYNYKPHNGAQEMARRVRQTKRDDSFELYGVFSFSGMGCRFCRDSHGDLKLYYGG